MKNKCACGYELDLDTHYNCPICGQYSVFDEAEDYEALIKALSIAGCVFLSFISVIVFLLIYSL